MTPPPALSVAQLGRLEQHAFVAVLGDVFEHSPWVAAESWKHRPFADIDAMHRVMIDVVRAAGPERQLALICAHPELAGNAALRGNIGSASREEQGAAGLNTPGAEDLVRFADLNERYRRKFDFPFIIAVAGRSRSEILAHFTARLERAREEEFATALDEIGRIARIRLDKILSR